MPTWGQEGPRAEKGEQRTAKTVGVFAIGLHNGQKASEQRCQILAPLEGHHSAEMRQVGPHCNLARCQGNNSNSAFRCPQ